MAKTSKQGKSKGKTTAKGKAPQDAAPKIDREQEAKRRLAHERRAALHTYAVACHTEVTQAGVKPGDIVKLPSVSISDREDIIVVFYSVAEDNSHQGSGLIVRNKGKRYDKNASMKLARKISKLLKLCAGPAGNQPNSLPVWGTDGGFPVDRPETGTWAYFMAPPLDEADEPIPMKGYREAKAPKKAAAKQEKAESKKARKKPRTKTEKALAKVKQATARAKPSKGKPKAKKAKGKRRL